MVVFLLTYAPIIISVVSLFLSIYFGIKSQKMSIYFDIDKGYADILKMAMKNPDLRDVQKTSKYYLLEQNDDYYIRYNIYAYMVWNHMETIFDHIGKSGAIAKLKSNTWLPVIKEENKIHYTWFKRNVELFKPAFYNFIIQTVNDLEIERAKSGDIGEIYILMEEHFPVDERKSFEQLSKLLSGEKYQLFLARHRYLPENENIVGYALCGVDHSTASIWLDYLAVSHKYQNAGYGTVLLKKVVNELGGGRYTVFYEQEIPKDPKDKKDLGVRRMSFYKRLGGYDLPFDYYLPTPQGSQKMILGVLPPDKRGVIYDAVTKGAIKTFLSLIHSDIPHVNQVIEKNTSNVLPFEYPPKQQ